MSIMKIRHFLNRVEHDRIHQAIQAAERGTAGRVVIYISRRRVKDAMIEAHRHFSQLHLETEEEKCGLLLFLAPKTQKFAVLGGTALHEKLGQSWWDHLAQAMTVHFKAERYTEGILAALEEVGVTLKAHFPSDQPSSSSGEKDLIEE